MLNRIFIVVGILAILALAAAFIVPRFIQWGDYRGRMEAMATEALGTQVEILGDIRFNLLPAPQLEFADVAVGPADAPVLKVGHVKADFSLVDFLRDHYSVTSLVLDQPVLNLAFDNNGIFVSGLNLPEQVTTSNISVSKATVVGGALNVADSRSGETMSLSELDGELKLQALRGPFAFSGRGVIGQERYALRVTTSAMDSDGSTRLTAFAQPESKAFSLGAEGLFSTGQAPRFAGDITFRQSPPPADRAEGVRGDLVLTSKVEANTDQVQMTSFTLVPDENRTGTRLTGSAIIKLGESRSFDATLSGGVVALPPRDATKEEGVQPYELVRLLGELPPPPVPPMPGTIALDLAELDMRGVNLRDITVKASSDGKGWSVDSMTGRLPGDTQVKLSGRLAAVEDRPSFAGRFGISTSRLDALAALWRKPADNNPLFNVPASFEAGVELDGDDLRFKEGVFTLDEGRHAVSGAVGFGPERQLDVVAKFSALSAADSTALAALLPETGAGGGFAVTFPEGHLTASAQSVALSGLEGTQLVANAAWGSDGIDVTQFSAQDLGGARLDLNGKLAGTLAEPRVAASGTVLVTDPDAPILALAQDAMSAPPAVRAAMARALPADLKVTLEPPGDQGGQVLTVTGTTGTADLGFSAQLGQGLAKALEAPVSITAELASDDPAALTEQLGLGPTSLFPEGQPVRMRVVLEGSPSNSFDTSISATGGGDSLEFTGNIVAADPSALKGAGDVKVALSDASPLAELLGAGGVHVPPISGGAKLTWSGDKSLALSEITGTSGGQDFSGTLRLERQGALGSVTGDIRLGATDVASLAGLIAGPAALIPTADGVWPEGPIAVGQAARTTRGDIAIAVPSLDVGGRTAITDARFNLSWDESNMRLRNFTGTLGGGTVGLELAVCCSGTSAEKQASGRLNVEKVEIDALLPPGSAGALGGTITGGAQFNGTGDSIAAMFRTLAGEGSYTIDGLSIARLDPKVFETVAGLDNILELEPDALTSIVALALDRGPFAAPSLSGAFTIAGGTVRSQNLSVQSGNAQLFGGTSLRLADLGLDGSFSLTPTETVDAAGLISPTTSQVTAVLSGSLTNPQRKLDLGAMVDAIKVRAYELEVDRLEQLRAEDEARQKAAAEERARLIAEQKKAAEEAAAKKAAEEEAARKAAEEAAANAAAQSSPVPQTPPASSPSTDITGSPMTFPPLDLQLTPSTPAGQ